MELLENLLSGTGIDPVLVLAGIAFLVVIGICVAGFLIYKVIEKKIHHDSVMSIPKGEDTTQISRLLQEKYKAERDDNDFKRQLEL